MSDENFFNEQTDRSKIKTSVVDKYFDAWSKVILATIKSQESRGGDVSGRLGYFDLFAGKGRYDDGSPSTPLLILQRAIANKELADRLVTVFNDAYFSDELKANIAELPDVAKLTYKPQILSDEVGDELAEFFRKTSLIPSLVFADPWGYKGLTTDLIDSILEDWGCDCIFFFNYTRINMGIRNEFVADHIDALFGKVRADSLRSTIGDMSPEEREAAILDALAASFSENGNYILPFRFERTASAGTSHHLVFVTRHLKGYEIMKDIMASESDEAVDGTPLYEYAPTKNSQLTFVYPLAQTLSDLPEILLREFAGRSLTRDELFEEHFVGSPFVKKHYNAALKELEAQDAVTFDVTSGKPRRKNTYPSRVLINFPER